MSKYRVETDVKFVFEDGSACCLLNGQLVDMMKLDSVQEYRIVLWGLASQALSSMVGQATTPPTQPVQAGPELAGTEQQLGAAFQDQHEAAKDRLRQEIKERLNDAVSTIDESPLGTANG